MTDEPEIVDLIQNFGGDAQDAPFWEACREGKFLLHKCNICGRHYWPASRCIEHGAKSMSWVETAGRGRLYTYTVMHKAYFASMKDKVPYVVGVIKLDEGPFFHANILECAYDDVYVDMPLEAVMQSHESGLTIPMFRPVTA